MWRMDGEQAKMYNIKAVMKNQEDSKNVMLNLCQANDL